MEERKRIPHNALDYFARQVVLLCRFDYPAGQTGGQPAPAP